ncbi:MAG: YggT family protein [Xanthomonadales bacterium]|nr:YggT family protein [Xanthomonadales bacterium]
MNTSGALIYLVSTLTDLYVTAILLRLLLQWVRADFYNPLSQFLVKVTNPVLVPARRLIPSIGKLDTASVLVMLLLELLQLVIVSLLSQTDFGFQFLLVFAVRKLLIALLLTYFVLIIARVIISWFANQSRHPLIPLIHQLTEPVLKPIKRLLPTMGGVDLSPLIALIALRALLLLLGW